jgi:hypothetical protein
MSVYRESRLYERCPELLVNYVSGKHNNIHILIVVVGYFRTLSSKTCIALT